MTRAAKIAALDLRLGGLTPLSTAANTEAGWRNGPCVYSEQKTIPYSEVWRIRVLVQVRGVPRDVAKFVAARPAWLNVDGVTGNLSYAMRRGELRADFGPLPAPGAHSNPGKMLALECQVGQVHLGSRGTVAYKLKIVIAWERASNRRIMGPQVKSARSEKDTSPVKPVRSRRRRDKGWPLAQGGLPSLGKRR